MGIHALSIAHRTDNKAYRIQTPQTPLVRNERAYSALDIDSYPLGMLSPSPPPPPPSSPSRWHNIGTNAVVAVVSYTGYDMEDAMIINRSAYERGFAHGSVYLTKFIDLADRRIGNEPIHHRFCNIDPKTKQPKFKSLDADGMSRWNVRLWRQLGWK